MLPIFWPSAVTVTVLWGAARPAITIPPSGLTRTISKLGITAPGWPGGGGGVAPGVVPDVLPVEGAGVGAPDTAPPEVAPPVEAVDWPPGADGAAGGTAGVSAGAVVAVGAGPLLSATSSRLMA